MTNIVNKDIRCGLFSLTINESWIHTCASERVDDECEKYDFDQDIDTYSVLQDCINDVERAINRLNCDDIDDIILDCISKYAELFLIKK